MAWYLSSIANGDKILHFLAGWAIGSAVVLTTSSTIAAMTLVVIVGIGKELIDNVNTELHTPDWMDAIVTIVGGLTAVQMVII